MKLRYALLVLAASAVVAGLSLSLGPPRVLWLNTGLRIEYEWKRGAAALLAAAGTAGLSAALRRTVRRVPIALAAAALAAFGAHRLVYRVEAAGDALRVRTLLGTTSLPWASITRIDMAPDEMTATSDGGRVRLGTARLTAHERAALERTIARRLRDASERKDERPSGIEGPPGTEPPR